MVDKSFSPEELARARAALQRVTARASSISGSEFELALAGIAALTDNGHTFLLSGAWPLRYNRIPLRFIALSDGLFVGSADAVNADLVGARVERIERRSWRDLLRADARYQGGAPGWREQFAYFFVESPEVLHAAGIARESDRVRIRIRLPNGRRVTRTIMAQRDPNAPGGIEALLPPDRLIELSRRDGSMLASAAPLYLQEPNHYFRSARLPEEGGYYIQLRFNSDFGDEEITPFVDAVVADLTSSPVDTVIVDLRFDMGGDLNTTRQLMLDLVTLVGAQGRVYAITSGRTFSAGIASLGYLEQAGGDRVVIVGVPVGDRLEFWAETDTIDLPDIGSTFMYATERHNYMTGCQEEDCHGSIRRHPIRVQTLAPDIEARLTSTDVRSSRDPAIEAIMQDLETRRAAR